MKHITNIVAAAAVVAILAVSCCPCRKASRNARPLRQTQWHLVQLMGCDVDAEPQSYNIVFSSDGTMSGRGDCNVIRADYTAAGKASLKIGEIASTRALCRNQERENLFVDVLGNAQGYEIDGDMLMLFTEGEVRAIFKAR